MLVNYRPTFELAVIAAASQGNAASLACMTVPKETFVIARESARASGARADMGACKAARADFEK